MRQLLAIWRKEDILLTYEQISSRYPDLPLSILQRLGCEPDTLRPLVCDGVIGKRTRAAVYLDPEAIARQGDLLSVVALDYVLKGAREIAPSGGGTANNRGYWVNTFARLDPAASLSVDRGAWCAFFASYCLDVWLKTRGGFPRVGGARRLVQEYAPQRVPLAQVRAGDLVAWESVSRPAPYGHVGIVVYRDDDCVWTIEGNVDLSPGVDGVAARCFKPSLVRADGARPLYAGRYG